MQWTPEEFSGQGIRFPRQKNVQQSISPCSAPLWEAPEEGNKHGVITAETEEQESAEMGHTAQEKGEKSLFKNSHLPIELSVESQGVLCAELDRRWCLGQMSHGPDDISR